LRQDNSLAHRGDVANHHDLVHQLGRLPHPLRPHINDPLAHRIEQRLALLKTVSSPAGHDGKPALDGDGRAAGRPGSRACRRPWPDFGRDLTRCPGRDTAHIDIDGAGFYPFNDTVFANSNGFNVRRVGDHRDYSIGRPLPLRPVSRPILTFCSRRQFFRFRPGAVEERNVISRLSKVPSQLAVPSFQADKTDLLSTVRQSSFVNFTHEKYIMAAMDLSQRRKSKLLAFNRACTASPVSSLKALAAIQRALL